jgi:hypothetical protein
LPLDRDWETVKVPIFEKVYTNIDQTELNDLNQELFDAYVDEAGGTVKRPGLSSLVDLGVSDPCSVDGIYWWEQKQYAVAVCKGNVFKLEWDGSTLTSTDLTGTTLNADRRVSFTSDGTYVFMANGGKINYTDGTAVTVEMADADAPTEVSHLIYLDNYLIANNLNTSQFNFSGVASPLSWGANDEANAVGDPDNLIAMLTFRRELYLLGPKSIEIWENTGDPTVTFQRLPGGFIQTGCIAPYSVVFTDNKFYWLNDKKVFVEFDGRSVNPIATDFDKEVQNYETAYNCVADRIEIDGKPFLIFSFPGENVTLCYNYRGETWSKWGAYDHQGGSYQRWRGNSYAFWIVTGKQNIKKGFPSISILSATQL